MALIRCFVQQRAIAIGIVRQKDGCVADAQDFTVDLRQTALVQFNPKRFQPQPRGGR